MHLCSAIIIIDIAALVCIIYVPLAICHLGSLILVCWHMFKTIPLTLLYRMMSQELSLYVLQSGVYYL